ncbi:MAG: PfkB family carbohydrate kinase [Chloroflexota bacterium]
MSTKPSLNSPKIIGIGLACQDYLIQVPDIMAVHQGAILDGYKVQGGGMTATALVAVSRLGGQAELWSAFGDDEHAPLIEAELEAEGVNLSQVIRLPNTISHYTFVMVDSQSGERAFLTSGIAMKRRYHRFEQEPDWTRLAQADALLVDGLWHNLGLKGLQVAQDKGIPTCGDIEYFKESEDLLPYIDYLVVPEEMAIEATGSADATALQKLARYGGRMVVITLGEAGTLYWLDGQIKETAAFDVPVVDTTGAGDVFHGAFVYGLGRGWSPEQLVLFSSAVSAIKCQSLGGRTGIPTLKQTRQFLIERGVKVDLVP